MCEAPNPEGCQEGLPFDKTVLDRVQSGRESMQWARVGRSNQEVGDEAGTETGRVRRTVKTCRRDDAVTKRKPPANRA